MGTHVVRPGDTLHGIAQRYGLTLSTLRALNTWIEDPDLIHPGQSVTVSEHVPPEEPPSHEAPHVLADFRGDLGWVHAREGHVGRPYWPGGMSGVTLDPGIDLGHGEAALVEQLYEGVLSSDQLDALRNAFGVRGEPAQALLSSDTMLTSIRISRDQALALFPHAAAPYWRDLVTRFPALTQSGTPTSVHTAFLSLGFNRGAWNRHLAALAPFLERRDWKGLAQRIGRMQQQHRLVGIRRRRRMEAALIEQELSEA